MIVSKWFLVSMYFAIALTMNAMMRVRSEALLPIQDDGRLVTSRTSEENVEKR